MLKPPMSGMTDTLEFVKNLWGGRNIPGAVPGMSAMPGMPGAGLSVEDLDKKIADLKAVESWLNLNMGMLRGSIQALEIQRGTLVTLKAMGDSMVQAMSQTGAASESAMAPFSQFFAQAAQAAVPSATARPEAPAATPASPGQAGAAPDQPAAQAPGTDAQGAAMPAAVAWWNLLQEQFRQAVASAMPPEGAAHADGPEPVAPDAPADAGADAASGRPARRGARGKTDKA